MAIDLQKRLKCFVPTYYKDGDEELNGEEWEQVQHLRKINNRETGKIAVDMMEQLSEIR